MTQPLRVVFAGTPDFAAVALDALLVAGVEVCAVYCQPDRPAGQGKKLVHGLVKQLALAHNIPVEQPQNFKASADRLQLASYDADLMVVVAYGLILPAAVLATPKYGCVNIHGSLLPRWRGAAPIHRAIEAGDQETGITIMQMDEGLDTGNMLLKGPATIAADTTGSQLHDQLAQLGGQLIVQYLAHFNPDNHGEPQCDDEATYAHKLSKQEAEIDWQLDAAAIERKIRAFNAWPVCFTFIGDKRLRVWAGELSEQTTHALPGSIVAITKSAIEVACGDGGILALTQLQADGAKAMSAADLLNSKRAWFESNKTLGRHD